MKETLFNHWILVLRMTTPVHPSLTSGGNGLDDWKPCIWSSQALRIQFPGWQRWNLYINIDHSCFLRRCCTLSKYCHEAYRWPWSLRDLGSVRHFFLTSIFFELNWYSPVMLPIHVPGTKASRTLQLPIFASLARSWYLWGICSLV